ncbi:MAG: fimbria/pilus periplasmic chaperone [Bdellovibrio sp.]
MIVFLKLSSFIISYFFLLTAYAFEFTPSVMNFEPQSRGATQKYNVYNTSDIATAVEISAVSRLIDENGNETLSPTKDFTIYPQLLTLKAGETRVVKVTYIGDPNLKTEKAYRIIAEQLSVNLKKKEERKDKNLSINFLMKYETSAYVTLETLKPKISVSSISASQGQQKEKMLEVVIENNGTAHQIFKNWSLNLKTTDQMITLSKNQIKGQSEFNLLPGNKIKIHFQWPANLKTLPSSAECKFKDE